MKTILLLMTLMANFSLTWAQDGVGHSEEQASTEVSEAQCTEIEALARTTNLDALVAPEADDGGTKTEQE